MFVDYNTVKECECGLIAKRQQSSKLQFANIPTAYRDVSLKDFSYKYFKDPVSKESFKEVAELVKWYLENLDENMENGKGLYFWSETKGSGKTMLAAAVANELINSHGKTVKFSTSLDILEAIRDTYIRNAEYNESELLNEISSVEILVIDDFGTERISDWAGEKFYQIVNRRYMNYKVTFFTSNYDLMTLKYDERITNRIKELSFVAHFPEESVRVTKALEENDFKNFKERKQNWEELEKEVFTGE